jgi:hypothetical protein
VLFVSSPFARVKLCRLKFGKDGSLYVSFPYLREKRGLLSVLADPDPPTTGPVTYNLSQNGVVVPVDVKFSQHTSGQVGFSLTGLSQRLPRAQGFALADGAGPVFQLHVHFLSGFVWLDEVKSRDICVGFDFPDRHPFGLRIEAHWWLKSTVAANTQGDGAERNLIPPGPRVQALDRRTGAPRYFLFIGQPKDCPLRDHILAVAIEPVPAPTGVDTAGMIFLGGFTTDVSSGRSSALAFLYPYTGGETTPA